MQKLLLTCVTLLIISCASNKAASNKADDGREFTDPEPWQETSQALPAYPQDADLIALDVQMRDAAFEFLVDGKSLVTSDDGVVHFTSVIRSDSGAKNVLREGLRCGYAQFKVYAYGQPDASFQPAREAEWKYIPSNGTNSWRNQLLPYMCDYNLRPLQPKQILSRIGNPSLIPRIRY